MVSEAMVTALNLSKEEDLTHILQDIDTNDMNDRGNR